MRYRKLGKWGLRVSEVGLGSWLTYGGGVEAREAQACLRRAFDLGINLFDTADVYADGEAERFLGQVLGDLPRSEIVIASKCYFPTGKGPNERGLSRKHIVEACDASLGRLGVETLDLYQAHRFDEEVPLEETARAMDHLVRSGKVLYWGTSRWPASRLAECVECCRREGLHPPVSEQPRYNLLDRGIEGEVLETAKRHGLGLLVYSPLAQGVLSGKYRQGRAPTGSRGADEAAAEFVRPWLTPERVARVEGLPGFAAELGTSPARLALAWCLRRPEVSSVIVGASRTAQVEENAGASGIEIPTDLLARIDEAFGGPAGGTTPGEAAGRRSD